MLIRVLCLAGLASLVVFASLTEDRRSSPSSSAVLGAGASLADVISGTYSLPEQKPRRAKVQLAVRKFAKRKSCGKRGADCQSRPAKLRDFNDGYRTLCVRLCDGFYFPISASVTPAFFARDEASCRAGCSSPAQLFVYKNGDGTPDAMEGLDGTPYRSLATAFQYRVAYDAACTCTPNPWTEAAADRHRLYALESQTPGADGGRDRERLAQATAERTAMERAQTGADLVVAAAEVAAVGPAKAPVEPVRARASATRKAAVAQGVAAHGAVKRGSVARAAAKAQQRRVRNARVAAGPWMARSLRSGAALAPRQARGLFGSGGPVRLSAHQVVVRVQR